MQVIEIRKTKRPFAQVLKAIVEMVEQGRERIVIHEFADDGGVKFSVPLVDLGLTAEQVRESDLLKRRAFVNFLGELLVGSRLPVFREISELTHKTDEMIAKHSSRDFEMRLNCHPEIGDYPSEENAEDPPPVLEFSFHVSDRMHKIGRSLYIFSFQKFILIYISI